MKRPPSEGVLRYLTHSRTLMVGQQSERCAAMLRSAGVYSPEECGYLLIGFEEGGDPVYERPNGTKQVFPKGQPMIVVKKRYVRD